MASQEKLAYPVHRVFPGVASANSCTVMRVDVPQLLSQFNSRLYRQGRTYRCQVAVTSPNSIQSRQYRILTLPNTWFTHGAYKHAFKNYRAAMQDELAQTGGKTSKWHDFHVKLNDPGNTDAGFEAVVNTGANWDEAPGAGEVFDSQVTNVAGTLSSFNMIGDFTDSYNILQEYALHLNRGADRPDDSSAGPQSFEDLFSGSDDLDRILEKGDEPPYDSDFSGWWDLSQDGSLTDADTCLAYQDTIVTATSGEGTHPGRSQWFDAPLGAIWLVTNQADFNYGSEAPELAVTVASGSYKGVKSEPIIRYKM